MANKQINEYDATTSPSTSDLLLKQPSGGGLYETITPADIIGLIESDDILPVFSIDDSQSVTDSGIYIVDTSSGSVTITIPNPGTSGKRMVFYHDDSSGNNIVTVVTDSGEVIGSSSEQVILEQDKGFTLVDNGSSWDVINDTRSIQVPTVAFYLTNNDSDVSGYKDMQTSIPNNVTFDTVVSTTTPVQEYITIDGYPSMQHMRGVVFLVVYCYILSGTKSATLQATLYKRNPIGSETLIGTSNITKEISDVLGSYEMLIPVDAELEDTDRIVVKITATPVGSGTTPTVRISLGETSDTYLSLPSVGIPTNVMYTAVYDTSGVGIVDLEAGGTGRDLSTSGGTGFVLKQDGSHLITSAALVESEIPNLPASKITSGQLPLERGGTESDLSATGGTGHVVKQTSSGAAFTVAALSDSEIPNLPASKITSGTLDDDRLPAVSSSSAGKTPETSGASDGDVLTVQADGSADWETPSGGGGGSATNLLINGAFNVWQRGTSITSVSEFSYAPDMWYALYQSNAVNIARTDGDEQRYACRITQPNATAQRMGIVQIVEGINCKQLRGNNATLSGRVKLSTADDVRFAIVSWTGTEDGDAVTDPNPNFSNTAKDLVNTWTSTTYTAGNFFKSSNLTIEGVGVVTCDGSNWEDFSLTSTSTMSASLNNVFVFIWTENTVAQNVTLDIETVQLEIGSTANDFQQRDVTTELMSCRRYYERFVNVNNGYYTLGVLANNNIANYPFKIIDKRTNPAISVSAASDFKINDGFTADTGTSTTFDLIGTQIFRFRLERSTSNCTPGLVYMQAANANSWIGVSAEL